MTQQGNASSGPLLSLALLLLTFTPSVCLSLFSPRRLLPPPKCSPLLPTVRSLLPLGLRDLRREECSSEVCQDSSRSLMGGAQRSFRPGRGLVTDWQVQVKADWVILVSVRTHTDTQTHRLQPGYASLGKSLEVKYSCVEVQGKVEAPWPTHVKWIYLICNRAYSLLGFAVPFNILFTETETLISGEYSWWSW